MSKLTNQWIDIFRAGNHGAKGEFTEADLDRVVANYKPEEHEAPAVVGHPKSNGPAYGWVSKLRRVGDLLQGKFAQVDPTFEEMVEAGRFKKRSASFYLDAATGRPSKLRHVGFLGAQPPEVKGLKDVQFQDEGHEVAEVTFEEDSMAQDDTLIERMLSKFEERFGRKPAAGGEVASFSEADVKRIAGEAVAAAVEAAVKPLQDKLTAQETSFSESQKVSATAATKARASEAISKLKTSGKWVPAFDRAGLVVVFEELAKTSDVVEFGEGAEKKSLTPLDALVSFMEQMPKIVPTGEVYTGAGVKGSKIANINESSRAGVDPNSLKLAEFAETRSKEKSITYGEALMQVASEHPELTIPGGSIAGAV